MHFPEHTENDGDHRTEDDGNQHRDTASGGADLLRGGRIRHRYPPAHESL